MTWVKICGITTGEALEAAHDAGADAVGFVLTPTSPRYLTTERAQALIARSELPSFLVTVDATAAEVEQAMADTGASGVQPHGEASSDVAAAARHHGWRILFPVPFGSGRAISPDEVPDGAMPLLDSASKQTHGGTGVTFDWAAIDDGFRPFVLAGGLGPDNVARAIRVSQPYGVDASSRLEGAPGIKDPDTIRAFIEEAKKA